MAHGKPLMIPEIGYRSQPVPLAKPWVATSQAVDLEAQRAAFALAHNAWAGVAALRQVFVWQWLPSPRAGGNLDAGYTPQNKPALAEVSRWFAELSAR